MLDDDEWAIVQEARRLSRDNPAAADALLEQERLRRGLPPIPSVPESGSAIYRTLDSLTKGYALFTGMVETVPAAVWHHVASLYGPSCEHCGKPLRTPRAKWCPACGGWRSSAPADAPG